MPNDVTTVWACQADKADIFVSLDMSPYPEDLTDHRAKTRLRGKVYHTPVHGRPAQRYALYEAREHLFARQGRDGLWFAGSDMRQTGYQADGLHHSLELVRTLVTDHAPLGGEPFRSRRHQRHLRCRLRQPEQVVLAGPVAAIEAMAARRGRHGVV